MSDADVHVRRLPAGRSTSRLRFVALLACVCLACSNDPIGRSVTGRWVGEVAFIDESWTIDMTITQSGSSVAGTAKRSNYLAVTYVVSGDQVGDSVFLRMRPPEDVDLSFGLRSSGDQLPGVMWFGTNRTGATVPVTFVRQ